MKPHPWVSSGPLARTFEVDESPYPNATAGKASPVVAWYRLRAFSEFSG